MARPSYDATERSACALPLDLGEASQQRPAPIDQRLLPAWPDHDAEMDGQLAQLWRVSWTKEGPSTHDERASALIEQRFDRFENRGEQALLLLRVSPDACEQRTVSMVAARRNTSRTATHAAVASQ